MIHAPLRTNAIKQWSQSLCYVGAYVGEPELQKPLLYDIQDKVVYDLDPVITVVKMQIFCEVSRNAGYHWAWTRCCMSQNNNQRSVNSMFVLYQHLALTIVYMSDVLLSSKSGALRLEYVRWTKLWAFEFLSDVTDQTENM
ncbi:uncharacterized protein HD556DRAFT_1412060 [Suillus plorans]|uniref:Heterokaryon incompatibility domain-containing protein n=1 Tax=Suillus plorans TaxID=116603 RepID=A0A9P7DB56_9AGAM|nr:uncharacterized protein HD556DRAFT_1412060 [Suillus plorans]KAG1786897.1 hypothetical protein HD556DRAFT_1412060 [Suillus plorans]